MGKQDKKEQRQYKRTRRRQKIEKERAEIDKILVRNKLIETIRILTICAFTFSMIITVVVLFLKGSVDNSLIYTDAITFASTTFPFFIK